jgi:tetratricopeptide (TPR) repeat protein
MQRQGWILQYIKFLFLSEDTIMEYRKIWGVMAIAVSLNAVGASLPSVPLTRSVLVSAVAQTVRERRVEAARLMQQGAEQADTSQYGDALQSYQEALAIYQQAQVRDADPLGAAEGAAWSLNNIGAIYTELAEPEKAIDYLKPALWIVQKLVHRVGEASVLMNFGIASSLMDQYQTAIDYYQQALPIFQAAKDRQGQAKVLLNLGATYGKLRRHQTALDYLQEALPIYRDIADRRGEAKTLINLGGTHAALSQYTPAIDYYQQALPFFEETGDRDTQAFLYASTGRLYALQNNSPQLGITNLRKSIELREAIRQDIQQLPADVQQAYIDSFADDYRFLAELLQQHNYREEAQQVLGFLQ